MIGNAMTSEETAEPKKKIEEWAVQTATNQSITMLI